MYRNILLTIAAVFISLQMHAQHDSLTYERSDSKVIIGGKMYYVHLVKEGESLDYLCDLYNVSQKEIIQENPEVFLGISVGQALKIPLKKSSDRKDAKSSKKFSAQYFYHRVKGGQTFFYMEQRYGVDKETLIEHNPELAEGLKAGQTIRIPKLKEERAEEEDLRRGGVVKTEKDTLPYKSDEEYIYHKVVPKETIFSLLRKYELTEEELLDENPFLKDGLKIDQVLKIPVAHEDTLSQVMLSFGDTIERSRLYKIDRTTSYKPLIRFCDSSFNTRKEYQVALMLPLFLEENNKEYYIDSTEFDDEGERIYERIYYSPTYIYPKSDSYIEFYEGILLAVDSLKSMGMSITLHVFDTQTDSLTISEMLQDPSMRYMDMIIGPVYRNNLKKVVPFAKEHSIPIVSPFSSSEDLLAETPNLFQVFPSYPAQVEEYTKLVSGSYRHNIILVHNGDSLQYPNVDLVKERLFEHIRKDTLLFHVQFKEVAFQDSLSTLEQALSLDKKNIVLVPTNNEVFVTDVLTNMNTLLSLGYDVKVFGMHRWYRFRNIDPEYYYNLNICLSTPFYVDYSDQNVQNFVLKFREVYRTEPDQYGFHGFDVGYYFLSAIASYSSRVYNCIHDYKLDLLQADFSFVQWSKETGFENNATVNIEYRENYEIVKLKKKTIRLHNENGEELHSRYD